MAKKRKAYNEVGSKHKAMSALLKRHHICVKSIIHSDVYEITHLSGKKTANTQVLNDAIFVPSHEWSVCIGMLCEDQCGKRYIKSTEFTIAGKCRYPKVNVVLFDEIIDLYSKCNPRHVVGGGWIGSPYDVQIQHDVDAVFERMGFWCDLKPGWKPVPPHNYKDGMNNE